MKLIVILFFILLPVTVLAGSRSINVVQKSHDRHALLIGNFDYPFGTLENPANDVLAIETILKSLNFKVAKYSNCSCQKTKEVIDNFGKSLNPNSVALFFYAGHGIQVDNLNYIIPVDAPIDSKRSVDVNCVRIDRILNLMEACASKTNILILDACRNNPFQRRYRSINSGLAFMDAPPGSLIAYSTSPGKIALDGNGLHSPYVEALIKNLDSPNINILEMFQRVRTDVVHFSKGKQIPWESTSLINNFYFAGQGVTPQINDVVRKRIALEKQLIEKIKADLRKEQGSFVPNPFDVVKFDGQFVFYANGIFRDLKTDLEWFLNPGKMNYAESREWCECFDFDGDDWRVPKADELTPLFKNDLLIKSLLRSKVKGEWVWLNQKQTETDNVYAIKGGSRLVCKPIDPKTIGRSFIVRYRPD